jgi:hypothetical protein
MAKKKTIVPVLLSDCDRHPKIEPVQYLDFKNHTNDTWQTLVGRIENALSEDEGQETLLTDDAKREADTNQILTSDDKLLTAKITGYMHSKGFRLVSFQRIIKRFDTAKTEGDLTIFVNKSSVFRHAKIKGGLAGLALL